MENDTYIEGFLKTENNLNILKTLMVSKDEKVKKNLNLTILNISNNIVL